MMRGEERVEDSGSESPIDPRQQHLSCYQPKTWKGQPQAPKSNRLVAFEIASGSGLDGRTVAEAGTPVTEVCRKMGVSQQTFYTWRRKFAGMGVAELRELRQLREENRKLKGLVADLSLDKHILQEVITKKL